MRATSECALIDKLNEYIMMLQKRLCVDVSLQYKT
jgi:hypothetical protein